MPFYVTIALYSAIITAVGTGLSLLALSHLGTGFGFGDVLKDTLKIALVSVLVGVADALWSLAPVHHWSFHVIVALVHGFLLRMFFFYELSGKEATMVAVVTRVLYFLVALVLLLAVIPPGG